MNRVLLLTLLLTLATVAGAEDYYCVSTTGAKTSGVSTTDIEAFGWANVDCYANPWTAAAEMTAGSQMWINDGDYDRTTTGDAILVPASISGTSGDYTIIRARNPGEVTVSSLNGSGIRTEGASYIYIEGIHVDLPILEAGSSFFITDASGHTTESHHITIKLCSFMGETALATAGSHHILFEDCFAYGGPQRYTFQSSNAGYDTGYIVYRRCVVRWDYSNVSEPQGCFGSYTTDHIAYQNCIAVDCTDNKGVDYGYDGAKAFFTPNATFDVSFEGCMVVAASGFAGWWLEGSNTTATLKNCTVWGMYHNDGDATDTYDPVSFACSSVGVTLTIENCTFGINDCVLCADPLEGGAQMSPLSFVGGGSESMRNSIVYGMDLYTGYYAVDGDLEDGDWNLYYGNTGDRNWADGPALNDITDVDPLTSGLFYKTQIEPCSALQTAGENGTQVGAQIKTKIGVDGTYYGETGWDLDTGEPLWPFPNEDKIRERCAAFYMAAGAAYAGSPEMIGARGFCSGTWTLSSYLRAGGE